MSEKDTISMQLVREALLQSCAPGAATDEVLHKVGIDRRACSRARRGYRPVPMHGSGACWRGAWTMSSSAWTRAA